MTQNILVFTTYNPEKNKYRFPFYPDTINIVKYNRIASRKMDINVKNSDSYKGYVLFVVSSVVCSLLIIIRFLAGKYIACNNSGKYRIPLIIAGVINIIFAITSLGLNIKSIILKDRILQYYLQNPQDRNGKNVNVIANTEATLPDNRNKAFIGISVLLILASIYILKPLNKCSHK